MRLRERTEGAHTSDYASVQKAHARALARLTSRTFVAMNDGFGDALDRGSACVIDGENLDFDLAGGPLNGNDVADAALEQRLAER
jgi:hypothetical protein